MRRVAIIVRSQRKGFALVIALTIMALLVLVILTTAGFLNIESRLAVINLDYTRTRLNALMSARLALAHLQQEAGPDQRSTARGDLTSKLSPPSLYKSTTPARARIGQGQWFWTGVWRTDRPEQPPAWIISGKGDKDPSVGSTIYLAQSTNLSGKADYATNQWAPWQTDYPIAASEETVVLLVGKGSAVLDVGPDNLAGTADDIDGRIALPAIPLPGSTLGSTCGGFAYWVGDEGVKSRINLTDPRNLAGNASTLGETADALRSPGRFGTELLLGFKNVAPNSPVLANIDRTTNPLLSGYDATDTPLAGETAATTTFHDHTYWSSGVLSDSMRGGLKKDLSLAFEMDDREFDFSEFGSGAGEAVEMYAADLQPGVNQRRSWNPYFAAGRTGTISSSDPRPRIWVPMWESNPDNPGRNLGTTGVNYAAWAPVFLREDVAGKTLRDPQLVPSNPTYSAPARDGTDRRLAGPLWHLVRDYYRLYKDVDWTANTPTLDARAFFPNTAQFVRGGYKPTPATDTNYSRFDLDNGYWSNGGTFGGGLDSYGGSEDPLGFPNPKREYCFIPRAVRGAYMPTIHRLCMVFSIKRVASGADYTLKLICTPVVVLHNPYNVRLRLKTPASTEADARAVGSGARIAFTDLDGLSLFMRSHVGNSTANPAMESTGAEMTNIFNVKSADSNANAENFTALIPTTTLEPGEFAVFSSKDLVPASNLGSGATNTNPVLKLTRGFYFTGGFYADFGTYTLSGTTGLPDGRTPYVVRKFLAPGASATLPLGDTVSTWIDWQKATNTKQWHHWFYFSSGWKQSLAGDRIGSDLGSDEVIGTKRQNSLASYGLMVNIGAFGGAGIGKQFFGDPGTQSVPVKIGPMSNIRDFSASGSPGAVIGAFDTHMRLADTTRRTTYDRGALTWQAAQASPVPASNPIWLFSNPLAQSSTAPSQNGMDSIGAPSLRTQVVGGDELGMNGASGSWSNLLQIDASQADGRAAFGGYSHGVLGATQVTEIEIPTNPPLSLGQFMHANVNVWDWFPYRTIGNSFPSLVVPLDKSWTHGTPAYQGGHTFPDMAYLLNNAVWDTYFLSGAAPRLLTSRTGNYNAVRKQSTQEVLDDFAIGKSKLANPRMRLRWPTGESSPAETFAALGFCTPNGSSTPNGYRRIAAYLLNEGAFNVNSTSIEAWTGLFASLKAIGLGANAANSPAVNANARYPRVLGSTTQAIATRDILDASYWSGYANLTDTQIRALAQGAVDEVKARAKFLQRTEANQEYPPTARRFRGFPVTQDPATPFLGLGEFVNRYLGPTGKAGARVDTVTANNTSLYPIVNTATETASPTLPTATSANRWMFTSGTLESAIARADKVLGASSAMAKMPAGATAIVAAISHNWNYLVAGGKRSGMPPGSYFKNIEILDPDNINRTHTGFGANGCLFQGDLLQALGPMLTTRSDTFLIRAYGESPPAFDGTKRSSVLEIVVQRTPDFVDPRDRAHARLVTADPAATPLKPINRLLGRRFIIISARWLSPENI